MPVLEIVAAIDGPRIVVALSEPQQSLEVWDIESRTRVSRFASVYFLGGKRLAIDVTGTRVVAAAWARNGVACYDANTGDVVWRRKDLTSNQSLAFSNDGTLVYCGQDAKPLKVLATATGADVDALRGIDTVWESPVDDLAVRAQRRGKALSVVRCSDAAAIGKLPVQHWTNDVAFTSGEICVAYPAVYGSEELRRTDRRRLPGHAGISVDRSSTGRAFR